LHCWRVACHHGKRPRVPRHAQLDGWTRSRSARDEAIAATRQHRYPDDIRWVLLSSILVIHAKHPVKLSSPPVLVDSSVVRSRERSKFKQFTHKNRGEPTSEKLGRAAAVQCLMENAGEDLRFTVTSSCQFITFFRPCKGKARPLYRLHARLSKRRKESALHTDRILLRAALDSPTVHACLQGILTKLPSRRN
jgi:hypothetical protein